MSHLSEEELDKLLHLCRIEWTEEEKRSVQGLLGRILDYFEQLNEIDTNGVEPCYRISEAMTNVLREDVVGVCSLGRTSSLTLPPHRGNGARPSYH